MTAKTTYWMKDRRISEDEALDENGLVKDGVTTRFPMFMRDSGGNMLVDALGHPLQAGHHGYASANTDAKRRIEDREYRKAELSARYKGGLADGDHVTIGDQRLEVTGRNSENNKLVLSDTAQLDADDEKRQAYDEGVKTMTDAWRTRPTIDAEAGGACQTSEGKAGKWAKGPNGALVCKPTEREPSDMEWELSGPLSDSDVKSIQAVRHAAWEQSKRDLEDAWRR